MQLRKLIICLEQNRYLDKAEKLIENLKREGLAAEFVKTPENVKQEGILYLTDSPHVCAALCQKGGYVMVFLHKENREADFSEARYALETLEEVDARYFERVYQRLTGQPWDILETSRCILRETVEEDVDAFYEIYAEPSMTRYSEPLYEEKEKEKQYIRDYRKYVYQFYEFGIWTVVHKQTGQIIGRAGINMRDGSEIPEIGFVIGVPWQHQGIAFEICTAILKYAEEALHMDALQALVRPENTASVRLCERLGFTPEKRIWLGEVEYIYYLRNLLG